FCGPGFNLTIFRDVNVTCPLRFTNDSQILFLVVFGKQFSDRRRLFYDLRERTSSFFARARPSVWPILGFDLIPHIAGDLFWFTWRHFSACVFRWNDFRKAHQLLTPPLECEISELSRSRAESWLTSLFFADFPD